MNLGKVVTAAKEFVWDQVFSATYRCFKQDARNLIREGVQTRTGDLLSSKIHLKG